MILDANLELSKTLSGISPRKMPSTENNAWSTPFVIGSVLLLSARKPFFGGTIFLRITLFLSRSWFYFSFEQLHNLALKMIVPPPFVLWPDLVFLTISTYSNIEFGGTSIRNTEDLCADIETSFCQLLGTIFLTSASRIKRNKAQEWFSKAPCKLGYSTASINVRM